MFELTQMEDCHIKVLVTDDPYRVGHLNVAFQPIMQDWEYRRMTMMEAEIVVASIVDDLFEKKFKHEMLGPTTTARLAHAIEQKINEMVTQGMFIGRRPKVRKENG